MTISLSFPFILASASPRRRDLLRSVGLKFKVIPAFADESREAGETPARHVRRLSRNKAQTVALRHPKSLVLGADTIVVIDGMILGKPKDQKQARDMLRRLSNRTHSVYTGFTLIGPTGGLLKTRVVRSSVQFKKISVEEMDWYVNGDEPYDKAGGYAVQGRGAYFIKSIRGSYTNVIGLPLCEVLEELKHLSPVHFRWTS
jgi:septum formation protein